MKICDLKTKVSYWLDDIKWYMKSKNSQKITYNGASYASLLLGIIFMQYDLKVPFWISMFAFLLFRILNDFSAGKHRELKKEYYMKLGQEVLSDAKNKKEAQANGK